MIFNTEQCSECMYFRNCKHESQMQEFKMEISALAERKRTHKGKWLSVDVYCNEFSPK